MYCPLKTSRLDLGITQSQHLLFKNSINDRFHERRDKWVKVVKTRLSNSTNLEASEVIYNGQCKSKFFTDESLSDKKRKSGIHSRLTTK